MRASGTLTVTIRISDLDVEGDETFDVIDAAFPDGYEGEISFSSFNGEVVAD